MWPAQEGMGWSLGHGDTGSEPGRRHQVRRPGLHPLAAKRPGGDLAWGREQGQMDTAATETGVGGPGVCEFKASCERATRTWLSKAKPN